MSISAVNGADPLYTDYISLFQQSNSSGTGSNTQVSGSQSNGGGNDTFMQSIMQALSQAGISMPSSTSGTPQNSSANLASDSSISSTNSLQSGHHHGRGLGKLMHDLVSAVESESGTSGSSSSSTSASAASSYSSFSNKLEQLISQVGATNSSSTPSTNSSISTLQSDLNNLVAEIQGASGTSSSTSAASTSAGTASTSAGAAGTSVTNASLQTFLQDLLANLGPSASASATGNFMNQYC